MGKAGAGAKAGGVAGVLTGLVSGASSCIYLLLYREEFLAFFRRLLESLPPQAATLLTPESMYQTALYSSVIGALLGSIVTGLIFGALAGWRWESLPGRGLVKGLVAGLIAFAAITILSFASSALMPISAPSGMPELARLWNASISLLTYLLWGAVTAALYMRWARPGAS
jgi:hypothetical protein